jgi:hypothetical protein
LRHHDLRRLDGDDADDFDRPAPRRARTPRRDRDRDRGQPAFRPAPPKRRPADGRESFKCGACRAFVGPTPSGGRHRNHCPLCLASRHVDGRRPGDRASACRSLMAPVGTFFRRKGEQVVLHRCRGCGLERHNRVAADDNPLALLRLPLVPPRLGRRWVVAPEGHPAGAGRDAAPAPFAAAQDWEDRETG